MKEKRIKNKEVRPRLDPVLYKRLKIVAEKEKRSINRQVELYIEEGLRKDGYQVNGGAGVANGQS
jgi:hypothetical protein